MATRSNSGSRSGGRTAGRSGKGKGKGSQGELIEAPAVESDDKALLEFEETSTQKAVIKVVGVGGGGGNALNTMVRSGLGGVEFIAANTDAQALQYNAAPIKVQLGAEITRGLGCGADPDKGRSAALEVRERLREAFEATDMVFVTAGLGGGTGTGAAPIVAEVARECGALTVGVVTKPFMFEGKVRMKHAERGLDELHRVVDTVITIPNDRLLSLAGKNTAMKDAFKLADDVLYNAVRGISDLITIHGLINLDFADVRTIMNEMGVALMGTGAASGEDRAEEAANMAISSPLLEDLSIDGAHGVLINITGGSDLSLFEVNEASTLIQEAAHEDANIIFGAVIDDDMPEGEMRVTVIATGLDQERRRIDAEPRDETPGDAPANVTQLRPEGGTPSEPVSAEQTPLDLEADPATPAPMAEEPLAPGAQEWLSPFEDELDVPTFLRKGQPASEEEDEPGTSTFLQSSGD